MIAFDYRKSAVLLALAGFLLANIVTAEAGQFRSSKRIGTTAATTASPGSAGARTTRRATPSFKASKQQFAPIERRQIEKMVRQTLEKWNTPKFADSLAPSFPDKIKVVESQSQNIPKDARLRVLSIQSVQTLSQRLEGTPGGDGFLVSRVSVTVKTQMEYKNATLGYKKFEGRSELILNVRQKLAGSGGQ